jgi:hypothetical protein
MAEMFLNFVLGEQVKSFSGVDISHVWKRALDAPIPGLDDMFSQWETGHHRTWEHWSCNWMGMKDSPYRSFQMILIAKCLAYGNRHDNDNPYHWECVVFEPPRMVGL